MTKKKNDLTFAESHAKLYTDMITFEEQENMGQMDEAIRETVKEQGFKKINLEKEAIIATDRQVGGDHYKTCKIQPVDYIVENNLTFLEGNVVKYITRHRRKGEGARDIEKVIHYCELILEKDYGRK
tara:strand:- start:68 stop:448 length:381 start_codon:yes stop_codon:yes gene_type:complete